MEPIPIAGPWITQKEIDYVTDAVTNGWYGNAGRYAAQFEAGLAEYVGRRYALALPSCTSALHLSLLALGVGPGDEVIVPECTWIATSAPVTYTGATPVFADIDRASWCLSPASVRANLSARTKAVIVVDLYGSMPDMDMLREVTAPAGVPLIEDAAQAIGAQYRGRRAGSFGVASTFSFHGTKALTTGEGGMLVTDDDAVIRRCRHLSDHGREPGTFWNTDVAFKYKMSAMQAALGLAQLERIDELMTRKREIMRWYSEELSDIGEITLNPEQDDVYSTYWMVTAVLEASSGITKETLMAALGERNIATRPFFYPLSSLPAYAHLETAQRARQMNSVAYDVSRRSVNLPSGYHMTKEKVTTVCAAVRQCLFTLREAEPAGSPSLAVCAQ